MPQLDDAIAALAANDTDRFMKDMDVATMDLDKMRDMAKKMEQAQAQAEKLGKDLAEQLKNGQAEAAANTLKKLAEQLKTLGAQAKAQDAWVIIRARNDAEGRWIYQQLAAAAGDKRIRAELTIGAPPAVDLLQLKETN